MKNLQALIERIIKLRIAIIVVLTLAMVFSAYQTIKNLSVDNSLSIWFLEDDPSYKAYIEFQEKFGSDEIFIAMLPVENAIDQSEIENLKALQKKNRGLTLCKNNI